MLPSVAFIPMPIPIKIPQITRIITSVFVNKIGFGLFISINTYKNKLNKKSRVRIKLCFFYAPRTGGRRKEKGVGQRA